MARRRGGILSARSRAFIRFEIPTIGEIYDAQGTVLVELAQEYRRVVSYEEVTPVLRDAILTAEDRKFFTHSGIEDRAGFDDNRALGKKETGGRTALPIFREVMVRIYEEELVGPVPQFPRAIEDGIDQYLAARAARE